jgi:hypothetical protein
MKSLIVVIFFSLLGSVAMAEESVVSLRTLLLSSGEMPESWVKVDGEPGWVQLPWSNVQPSVPLKTFHDGSLKLLRPVEAEDGEESFQIVRSVKLPPSAKEVLLLGMADDGESKYVAIRDVFLEAKFNDWMAINISDQNVSLKLGDKGDPLVIGAGTSLIFEPDIEELTGVKIIARALYKGKMRPFLSSYWPAFSGQRTMMIFYQDGKHLRAKRIGDRFIRPDSASGQELQSGSTSASGSR